MPTTWALVIETNTRDREEPITLAIIDSDPVPINLSDSIGAARVKWSRFLLGNFTDFPPGLEKRLKALRAKINVVYRATLAAIELDISRAIVARFTVDLSALVYDGTNFFTYIDTRNPARLPQRGHDKAKRTDLRRAFLGALAASSFGAHPEASRVQVHIEEWVVPTMAEYRAWCEANLPEYLGFKRVKKGRPARAILGEVLPDIIAELPFPKTMRWGEGAFRFSRPIHNILCLVDGTALEEFVFEGLRANDTTRGHRILAPQALRVRSFAEYRDLLRRAFVIIDPAERRARVESRNTAARACVECLATTGTASWVLTAEVTASAAATPSARAP